MIYTLHDSNHNPPERCQVCVIGSGAGGAVVAAKLAQAGYDVVVLEEGGYFPTTSFSHDPLRMLPRLYRHSGGDRTFGKVPIMFTEGRCVGGSTVVNAGICYRTPPEILHRWAMTLGSQEFLPENMASYFDDVERILNVTAVPDELFAKDARIMQKAAEALGFSYVRARRNIHACQGTNQCILGCPTGAKQSTLVTYIPQAEKAGARVYSNCRVQRLVIDGDVAKQVDYQSVDPVRGKTMRRGSIRADFIFVAGGAMQTPALLHRSGLAKKLKMIGKSLYLHPNAKCVAVFDEEIQSWQGSIQSIQIDEFAEEGFNFGSTFLPPGILALSLPFFGQEIASLLEMYNHLSVWGVLVEDSHPGRLYFTPKGRPLATYKITPADQARVLEGVVKLSELFFAAGARKVILPIRGMEYLHGPDDIQKLQQAKIKARQLNLFSVHLLGTCRMGQNAKTSVVNLDHRVHGLKNVYISDASVFPGPIRVNPMITIMALATRAAQAFQESAGYRQKAA